MLRIENYTKRYNQSAIAVDKLSLHVKKGDIFGYDIFNRLSTYFMQKVLRCNTFFLKINKRCYKTSIL